MRKRKSSGEDLRRIAEDDQRRAEFALMSKDELKTALSRMLSSLNAQSDQAREARKDWDILQAVGTLMRQLLVIRTAFPAAGARFLSAALAYHRGLIHSGELAKAPIDDGPIGVRHRRRTGLFGDVWYSKKIGRRLAKKIMKLKFDFDDLDAASDASKADAVGLEYLRRRDAGGYTGDAS